MANNKEDIAITEIFGTVLMSEVAVLLAIVVAAVAFAP
jgi:FlaG/FlaF family flagellin (archaellin)